MLVFERSGILRMMVVVAVVGSLDPGAFLLVHFYFGLGDSVCGGPLRASYCFELFDEVR